MRSMMFIARAGRQSVGGDVRPPGERERVTEPHPRPRRLLGSILTATVNQ